jgi:anti-sigma B factor antagonist
MPRTFGVEVMAGDTNGVRLRVSGDLDLATGRRLLETIMSVAPGPMHEVVVDVADVPFMDSSGLAVLIQAHQRLGRSHVRMVIANSSGRVAELLQVTGADHYLNVDGAD